LQRKGLRWQNYFVIFCDGDERHQLRHEMRCLLPNCNEPNHRRGLCSTHYGQFTRALAEIPEENREQFEEDLISQNKLLPSAKPGKKQEPNVFREVAEKYVVAPSDAVITPAPATRKGKIAPKPAAKQARKKNSG